MGQSSQASGGPAGGTDFVPKKAGTSWLIAIVLLVVGLLLGTALGYYVVPRPGLNSPRSRRPAT
ncbi:MAG: hypothetical protein E6K19_08680 [Methanobacteriota archaeon]|nr:MAG: hypothetical protein E6K19_08680 [Euryarchaeota archaeon]